MGLRVEISDNVIISCPREEVWRGLNDLIVLRNCIPGCEELHEDDDGKLGAVVTTKVGPIKARFKGTVELSDLNPPISYVIAGEGKGGAAGFASGMAKVKLEEHPEGTMLSYTVNVKIGGKLAQLGARLIKSVAKKLSAQFFESFSDAISSDTAT